MSRLNFVIYLYWWLLKCSKRWPGGKRKEQWGTMEGSEGLRAIWRRSEFSFWWGGNVPIFLSLLPSRFVLNCLFIKNWLKIRGLLWLRIQVAACQQREASLAVTTVCFKSEQVHPVPPSLTGTALTIERHQTEKKKTKMSENVLGQSFQLAKCLHDSMNTDERYQPV